MIASERSGIIAVDMIEKTVLLEMALAQSRRDEIFLSPDGRHVASTVWTSEGPEVQLMTLPRL